MDEMKKISENIIYIGADDTALDLFESQYPVPEGVSYNSYVIRDRKIAVMDTVDERATDAWFDALELALDGKAPDYLIVSHLEPDHSANIARFLKKYPETLVVATAKAFTMLPQFFDLQIPSEKRVVASEGSTLELGAHTLQFFTAPMVHWPEVMVTYEQSEKILFSADSFGTFGTLNGKLFTGDGGENAAAVWAEEARRYYINIVGKYGAPVQALLKKAAGLDIRMIAPLHGPVINAQLDRYIKKYDLWSRYEPEENGIVIAAASLHGNTLAAAYRLEKMLLDHTAQPVCVFDLARDDLSRAVAKAFQYDKLVLAGVTYDGGLMPCMEDFIYHLKMKSYQGRKAAVIENGSWGPVSGKLMTEALKSMKNITLSERNVTIKTTLNAASEKELSDLAEWLLK